MKFKLRARLNVKKDSIYAYLNKTQSFEVIGFTERYVNLIVNEIETQFLHTEVELLLGNHFNKFFNIKLK